MKFKKLHVITVILLVLFSVMMFTSCTKPPKTDKPGEYDDYGNGFILPDNGEDTGTIVNIPDAELLRYIREYVNKPSGDITTTDMEKVKIVNIYPTQYDVYDLEGLQYCLNMQVFYFSNGTLKSLDPLAKLESIVNFTFSYSELDRKPTIKFNMQNLNTISLADCELIDMSFLSQVKAKEMSLSGNGIENLDFLTNNDVLEVLMLSYNNIESVEPLGDKVNLRDLCLDHNEITSIDALSGCTSLEILNISYNNLTNIDSLLQLLNLKEVTVYEYEKGTIPPSQIEELINRGLDVKYTN